MSATRPVVPDERPRQAPAGRPLDRLRVGDEGVVLEVGPAHRDELATEGLLVGRTVLVTGRAPFRGPILVTVGRARLALSRDVAADVLVR